MTWEKDAVMKRCELPDYLNNMYRDFKDVLIKHLAEAYSTDTRNEVTLYGNVYTYVNDECDGVNKFSYRKLINICDSHLDVEIDVVYQSGEKDTIRMCLNSMSVDMLMDMIQNIP